MTDPETLIAVLDRARQRLAPLIESLEASEIVYPGWTVKQLLAHFAGWDDCSTASLKAYAAGAPPPTPAEIGLNPYNAQSVAQREALSLVESFQAWEASRQQLKAALRSLPPEKQAAQLVFPWGPSGTVEELILILADHEAEHAEEIERIHLSGQGHSPEAI